MKTINLSLLALILTFTAANAAKTPQQLKTELAGILPADKKARLAWLKGGYQRGDWDGPGASLPGSRDHSVYVMDSDDGIVRELTPTTLFTGGVRNIDNPSITFDGSRVVFSESYSNTFYVINWNGSNLKSFYDQGYLSRYWRDRTSNTDWVTMDENSSSIYKINIDNPVQKTLLWNKSGLGRPWYTLSTDGTHMAFNCPHPTWGIATVPNGTLTTLPGDGCFINISPDDTYRTMPQNGNHSIHSIYSTQGTVLKTVTTSATILAGYPNPTKVTLNTCNNGEMEYETTRWVQPDYLTFFFYATNVNPFVECISTGKWMYIHDAQELGDCGWAGNMDMLVLDPSSVSKNLRPANAAGLPSGRASGELYALNGRRLGKGAAQAAGMGIAVQSPSQSSGKAQILLIQ